MRKQQLSKWVRAIGKVQEPHHDTLYVTHDVYSTMSRGIQSGLASGAGAVEGIQVAGLNVKEIPRPTRGHTAIVCEEGEVFPTAGDYKQNDE